MCKVLITADIHIHNHRNDMKRIDDGVECLKWIYETACVAGIKNVIFAGDFFHHRYSLSTMAISKAFSAVKKAYDNGINTIFLLGNHDMYFEDSWEHNSLAGLNKWITVIDKPTKYNIDGYDVDFLPYTPKPSNFIDKDPFISPSRVLISHLAIANAILNSRYNILSVEDDSKDKEYIDADKLNKWEKVWLGHYHYGQKVSKNVEYIGSPMQLTFADANQQKHVAIFDLSNLTTFYVENKISPRFYIVEDQAVIDRLDINNSYVQMLSSEVLEAKFDLRKKLSKLGAREIEFISTQKDIAKSTTQALDNISQIFNDKNNLIDSYVDGISETNGLEKNELKRLGKEIVNS